MRFRGVCGPREQSQAWSLFSLSAVSCSVAVRNA
jgi:hypothetical protein